MAKAHKMISVAEDIYKKVWDMKGDESMGNTINDAIDCLKEKEENEKWKKEKLIN